MINSLQLQADAFIYDLEDAVSPSNKSIARSNLVTFLTSRNITSQQHRVIRVNCPFATEWGMDDVAALSSFSNIHSILLPKVENADMIHETVRLINSHRPDNLTNISVWAMIETAKGVLNAASIAKHSECLVFGSNDLTREIRSKHTVTREPLLYSMSHTILAARSERKRVVDGVHNVIQDTTGLERSCVQGRELGFDGKTVIHPSQIDTANRVYSPSEADIEYASRVISAYEKAQQEGKSLAVVDGKLVEALHVQDSYDIIEQAKQARDR
jgi:citrate lyase beta subunit